MFIVDPPSFFAPRSEWEAHLARLEKLIKANPEDESLTDAMDEARAHLSK